MILLGTDHWVGLALWLRDPLLAPGLVGPHDALLLRLTDELGEADGLAHLCHLRQHHPDAGGTPNGRKSE